MEPFYRLNPSHNAAILPSFSNIFFDLSRFICFHWNWTLAAREFFLQTKKGKNQYQDIQCQSMPLEMLTFFGEQLLSLNDKSNAASAATSNASLTP